ncbi:hypothetical protein GJ496_000064 [Pomphorhynchus laevis]|nr:hypothetical protein GJ496_000064 [Pomphorhynchus laevis]
MDDSTPPSRFSGVDPHSFNVTSKSIAHCHLSRHTVVDVSELSLKPNNRLEPITGAISVDVRPDTVDISDTAGDFLRAVSSGLNRVVEQPNCLSDHVQSVENTECYTDPAMLWQRKPTTNRLLRKHGYAHGCPGSGQPAANGALPANEIDPDQYITGISEAVDHISDCD